MLGPPRGRVRGLRIAGSGRSFDPTPGALDVADPYYDGPAAFVEMFDVIEAAMPRLLGRIAEIATR